MTINFSEVVVQMAVMLSIVLAGYAAQRFKWLGPTADTIFS